MNPYEVLGVSENADEETIKKAYKRKMSYPRSNEVFGKETSGF